MKLIINFFNSSAGQITFGSFLTLIISIIVTNRNAKINKIEQQRNIKHTTYLTFLEHYERGKDLYNLYQKKSMRVSDILEVKIQNDISNLKKIEYSLIAMLNTNLKKHNSEFEKYIELSKKITNSFHENNFGTVADRVINSMALEFIYEERSKLFDELCSILENDQ